ncbi:MAG: peroxiredoxin [Methylocystis sp.]|nr:MAG: peroxiredoxin [Methylocystis sp.]
MATKAAETKTSTAKKAAEKKPAPKPTPAKAAAAPPVLLEEGAAAPAFTLPGAGGEAVSLDALKGQKIVLYFYPKDDTSGCTKEAIEFNALRDKFGKARAVVVGMSPDSVKSHDKFREKYQLALPLASDETKEILGAYGVWVEKSMYGRKYMGVERTTFLIGANGKIAKIWRKVKVPGHADEVLAAAAALK